MIPFHHLSWKLGRICPVAIIAGLTDRPKSIWQELANHIVAMRIGLEVVFPAWLCTSLESVVGFIVI